MDNWEIYYRTHVKGVGKVLTGSPPLSFVSNGQPFSDYRIYGNSGGVGDLVTDETAPNYGKYKIPVTVSGKNLLPPPASSETITQNGITFTANEDGTYTIKGTTATVTAYQFRLKNEFIFPTFLGFGGHAVLHLNNNPAPLNSSTIVFWYNNTQIIYFSLANNQRIVTASEALNNKKVNRIGLYVAKNATVNVTLRPAIYFDITTLTDFVPYVDPITTNIYLNEPLSEGESISMSDTRISIPTVDGTNILTVDTEVQPSEVYIKYGSGNVNQSLMKYLEYKYKFAKE